MKCYRCDAENPDGKNFCSDCGASLLSPEAETLGRIKHDLEVELDQIVDERFRDQHFVEVEITERIVKRLTDWAKTFGLVFAIPLSLLIISLGTLGIKTYNDFIGDIENARKKLNSKLEAITSTLENSKKTADDVEARVNAIKGKTALMEAQANQVQALLKSVASLSDDVKVLTGEKQTISSLRAQNKSFGIDMDHNIVIPDWNKLKNAAVDFVFIKATQGLSFVDPTFADRWNQLKTSGFVRGAYHMGVSGDPKGQADRFLKIVNPVRGDLLVLDWEPGVSGRDMTLDEAIQFVSEIHDKVGRYPIIYGGTMLRDVTSHAKEDQLKRIVSCDLWYARYSSNVPTAPKPWQDWTFWQMSDREFIGGIGPVDYNVFNGTKNQLIEYSLR